MLVEIEAYLSPTESLGILLAPGALRIFRPSYSSAGQTQQKTGRESKLKMLFPGHLS
jgi:hypothetical protein